MILGNMILKSHIVALSGANLVNQALDQIFRSENERKTVQSEKRNCYRRKITILLIPPKRFRLQIKPTK